MTSLVNNNSFSGGVGLQTFYQGLLLCYWKQKSLHWKFKVLQSPQNTHTTTLVYARQYSFWMLCTTLLWSLPSSLLVPYFPTLMPSIQCLPLSVFQLLACIQDPFEFAINPMIFMLFPANTPLLSCNHNPTSLDANGTWKRAGDAHTNSHPSQHQDDPPQCSQDTVERQQPCPGHNNNVYQRIY